MEPQGCHLKPTAILSADAAGYSRLTQDDEAATVRALESYGTSTRERQESSRHRGRKRHFPCRLRSRQTGAADP